MGRGAGAIRNALWGAAILGTGIVSGHLLARAHLRFHETARSGVRAVGGRGVFAQRAAASPSAAAPVPGPAAGDAGVAVAAAQARGHGERDLSLPERGLHGAAARGDIHRLRTELDQGAPIDEPDSAGRTPLAIAVLAGELEAFVLLLQAGASVSVKTHDDKTLLMLAAQRGQQAMVERLLKLQPQPSLEARDRAGDTALLLAARHGEAAVACLLIDAGARIDVQGSDGLSPLMHAAARAPDALLASLVERAAALELRDRHGATALCVAADRLRPESARLLLDAGARVDAANHAGLTPLGYALTRRTGLSPAEQERQKQLGELLAAAGADFTRLHAEALRTVIDVTAFDALAVRHGQPAWPAPAAEPAPELASHVTATTDGAVTRLFELRRWTRSSSLPERLDPDVLVDIHGRERVANVVRAVEILDLTPGPGQRITLAGDAEGQWGFSVVDALLFASGTTRTLRSRYFVGAPEQVRVDGFSVKRLGRHVSQHRADSIELAPLFQTSSRVVIRLLDWGGHTMNSDIFLRVLGPGAARTLSRTKLRVLP